MVKVHFRHRRDFILTQVRQWQADVETSSKRAVFKVLVDELERLLVALG